MSLSADTLLDRIRLKSQLRRWRVMAILLMMATILLLLAQAGEQLGSGRLKQQYIARITIDEIIIENQEREALLKEIRDSERIKAVVVHINSPGGTMVGGETLYEAFSAIEKKKPLVVVMGGVAASGGYMVALPADQIFAHKGTITGSIGVYLQSGEVTELAKKLGISFTMLKSGPLKGSPSPFEKLTPEVTVALQETVMDNYNTFVDMVAARRPIPRAKVLKLADGRIFTGKQAVKHKLVDAIGGETEALAWLKEKKNISDSLPVKDVKLKKPSSILKELFDSSAKAPTFVPEALTLEGVLTLWHPGLFSNL